MTIDSGETLSDTKKNTIGFIGLGAMGGPMARRVIQAGASVRGYDKSKSALEKFEAAGGIIAARCSEAAQDVSVLVIMVANSKQIDLILDDSEDVLATLKKGATIMMCSTVSPDYTRSLEKKLSDKGFNFLDAPVSGGVVGAESGTLTIMMSGQKEAQEACSFILSNVADKVFVLGDTAGAGSAVKMINQLLAGVHIAVAAEAMALAARMDLDTRTVFEIISVSAGASWMFKNRVPFMLENNTTPRSALDIFVKDLGIVLGEAGRVQAPTPIASMAHQLFLTGSGLGLGRYDDSAVVQVFERLTGTKVSNVHEREI